MTKLLFDQNLSPRLVEKLSDLYPNSAHTDTIGFGTQPDEEVWKLARAEGYIIVTKDADFSELSVLKGAPPKVIWIRRGNCSTKAIETLMKESTQAISVFSEDPESSVLTLF